MYTTTSAIWMACRARKYGQKPRTWLGLGLGLGLELGFGFGFGFG